MNKIELVEKPILNECLRAAHEMLTKYWGDISRVRDASDQIANVTLSYKIDCTQESPVVKTKIGFSRRYRDYFETTIDSNQTEFPFLSQLS